MEFNFKLTFLIAEEARLGLLLDEILEGIVSQEGTLKLIVEVVMN